MADRTYATKLGDTWDVVSLLVYGSELFASDLIGANWEHRATAIFGAGVVLRVPPLPVARKANANLPPWRRGL